MKNKQKLTEQQRLQTELLELMEIGDFTKAISRKVGQGVGAIKGAGQKVKGVAKRSVAALGNAYTQGIKLMVTKLLLGKITKQRLPNKHQYKDKQLRKHPVEQDKCLVI